MSFQVITAGPLSTIQDKGRFGYQQFGIGTNGVMDQDAYQTANQLLENQGNEAVIETTLFGPTLTFDAPCICVITGADIRPLLDDLPIKMYHPFYIKAGQTLTTAMAVNGCRSYIAFKGGINVPILMNSRSTNLKCHMGGFQGRALQNGDSISLFSDDPDIARTISEHSPILSKFAPEVRFDTDVTIRVIEGPQDSYFTEKGKYEFYHGHYEVTPESDRMGYRLEGPAIENRNGVDIVSDGIASGSIQVPSNGKPIILLSDRQTTGGYAKIATVISKDLPKLAQLKPGDHIRFQKITVEEAQNLS
ncbi:MAG: biotin-dependent carboxyltransferase family protein [Lachnospiraceae bacterium]